MASVTLCAIWLSDVADPSDHVSLEFVRAFRIEPATRGRVVIGAGGRKRLIRHRGEDVTWTVSLGRTTPEQKAWLAGHKGRLLCLRDDRGNLTFGTYMSVPFDERTWSKDADASFEFTELTYSPEV